MICLAAAAGAGLYVYYRGRGIASETNSGQTPNILSELPPDAPVVAYIDVAALRKLQTSPFAAILGLAGASPAEDKDYAKFVTDTGFDYTRDLNAVAIAIWPSGLESSSKSADRKSGACGCHGPLRPTENKGLRAAHRDNGYARKPLDL